MYYSSFDVYNADSVFAFYPEYALLRKDLYPNRGVDFKHIFEIKDRFGNVQSIEGTIEGEIIEFVGSAKKIPVVLNVIDALRGVVEIQIKSIDLTGLRRNVYPYQIRAIDGNQVSLLAHGHLVFADY